MPYFFNGHLYITPTTVSAVNDDAMLNQNLSVGNVLAVIGQSTGGTPNTPLVFGDPATALATLRTGELAQAVTKAFNPSNEVGGPTTVVAIRVNPAVQAGLTLLDSSANPAITLLASDYGQYTNQINVDVAAGSTNGVYITTALGSDVYAQDNIYAAPMTVVYTGAQATATVTVTDTTMTLSAPAGTPIAAISLASFPTVQQLVDNINTFPGFAAAVLGVSGSMPSLNGLDGVTAQSIKTTAFTVTAVLQAAINYLNSPQSGGLVVAARPSNALLPPAPLATTYLTGGTDGTVTNTQWSNAFTTLQTQDVNWIAPLSATGSIIAMADAHVQYMSTVGRKERRAICGMALGTTDAQALTEALSLNSNRTSIVHIGYYDYDWTNQVTGLQLYSPYMAAAVAAAAFSGVSPGTPLTNKALTFSGVERRLTNPTETDPLIQGGVFCIESTSKGYYVVQSISTWLVDSKYDKVEQSVGWALDFVCQNVRNALDPLRGQKMTPQLLRRAVDITESQLRALAVQEPQGPGVITGDAASPAYTGITASAAGDVLSVQFQCSPVLPANYVAVTVYAVPYSGTATAS
jgi:hypothetical protein